MLTAQYLNKDITVRPVSVRALTFDHDHVNVDGADRRLRQALPFLQDVRDISCRDAIVRFASKGHQLPDGHSWKALGKSVRQKKTTAAERKGMVENSATYRNSKHHSDG